jgi:crossover junction endodeoxyribonuclease RuvC
VSGSTSMLTLGIDPGTAITGYGLVEGRGDRLTLVDYGVITTPAGEPLPLRLQDIHSGLTKLVQQYRPDSAAVEELFFSTNARTALAVGQARGVALLSVSMLGVPVFEYTPLQVKQAVTGYGRADKAQVQAMVRVLLALDAVPRPDDAADAVAVAICHLQSFVLRQKLGI